MSAEHILDITEYLLSARDECPACSSTDVDWSLTSAAYVNNGRDIENPCLCNDCGYQWTETYRFVSAHLPDIRK
jgi:hypothetical protein